ncbi:MAG: helix-turn-helix domain-containing protein [Candidatus Bathyarchaeota archaeon]|nr:helix-turn-helix domain-containing protein [Candidatus Bathyarchaeota archaeon]
MSQAFSHCGQGLVGVEDVATLTALGLTGRQARVYLALLKTGTATAKTIAQVSQINRQDIHRVINTLQQTGFIQKEVTTPTTFTPTPIKQTLHILLHQKTHQLTILKSKTELLTKKYRHPQITQPPPISYLGTLSEADHGKKHKTAIQDTQHHIQIVTTWKQFRQATTIYENHLKNALNKHAIIQMITQKPQSQLLPNWVKYAMTKNNTFKLKFLDNPPAATFTIFDDTKAAIALSNTASFTRGPHLWTNNPTLIATSQAYFNTNWELAE